MSRGTIIFIFIFLGVGIEWNYLKRTIHKAFNKEDYKTISLDSIAYIDSMYNESLKKQATIKVPEKIKDTIKTEVVKKIELIKVDTLIKKKVMKPIIIQDTLTPVILDDSIINNIIDNTFNDSIFYEIETQEK